MKTVKQIVFTGVKKAQYLVADEVNLENIGDFQVVVNT